MAKELYVGHISENANEEDVRKLFSVMGTVTSVHLIFDPETKEFKRCGYVRMAADVDFESVVETLDGALLVDRVITVSIARPQIPGMSKSGKSGKFGGPRKPGLGPKTGGAARGSAGPRSSAEPKGRPERPSGDGPKSQDRARRAEGPKSAAGPTPRTEQKPGRGPGRGKNDAGPSAGAGRGYRPGGENKAPRKGR